MVLNASGAIPHTEQATRNISTPNFTYAQLEVKAEESRAASLCLKVPYPLPNRFQDVGSPSKIKELDKTARSPVSDENSANWSLESMPSKIIAAKDQLRLSATDAAENSNDGQEILSPFDNLQETSTTSTGISTPEDQPQQPLKIIITKDLDQTAACCGCGDDFGVPIMLTCNHLLCLSCMMFEITNKNACPHCSTSILQFTDLEKYLRVTAWSSYSSEGSSEYSPSDSSHGSSEYWSDNFSNASSLLNDAIQHGELNGKAYEPLSIFVEGKFAEKILGHPTKNFAASFQTPIEITPAVVALTHTGETDVPSISAAAIQKANLFLVTIIDIMTSTADWLMIFPGMVYAKMVSIKVSTEESSATIMDSDISEGQHDNSSASTAY